MTVLSEKTAAPAVRPAAAAARPETLNLAGRPFTNSRPVVRVALLLWLLGALLLLGNVSLFWAYLSGSGEKRADLARMEAQVEHERREVAQLEARLAHSDLDRQNRQVRFLNRKIAERTFSWSLLFDRIAEVLPDNVRLTRLAPSGLVDNKDLQQFEDAAPLRPRDNRVTLIINAESKSDEGLSRFVENLFAHPSFEDPDFSRESSEEGDLVKFDIKVMYLPSGPPQPASVLIEEQPMPASPAPAPSPARPAVPEGE